MPGQLTIALPAGRWWVVGGTPPYKGGCPTTTAPCRDWWDVPPCPGIQACWWDNVSRRDNPTSKARRTSG